MRLESIDLNCDVGELADAGRERALMRHITSANIACGGHAGDDATMERTARLALQLGVRIGAHPGYPDPARFGRVALPLPAEEIACFVLRQLQRLDGIVRGLGGVVGHVKPHGALYNVAAGDPAVARAIGQGVAAWNRAAPLVGLAGSRMLDEWRAMGMAVVAEGFADRAYQPDGTLRPRHLPGALITEPAAAAAQAVRLARAGTVQTICVHGDTPGAGAILRACRDALRYLVP